MDRHFFGYTSDSSVQRLSKQFGTFWHHILKTQFPARRSLAVTGSMCWRAVEYTALVGQGCQLFLLCTDVDVSICANTCNSVFLHLVESRLRISAFPQCGMVHIRTI